MIAFAEVRIGTGGTLACQACARQKPGTPAEPLELEDVRGALSAAARSWTDGPGPNVAFVGLEPFAHPELPAILRAAVDLDYRRIRLRTDAGALAAAGNAEGVLGAGVRHLEVVLLADAQEHDRLVGRAGLFAAVALGVKAFLGAARSAGTDVVVTGLVPACRHNAASLPSAVARLAEMGATAVHVDASECPERDFGYVLAALDTAAVNAVAASVSGASAPVPVPWSVSPWRVAGEGIK